MNKLKVIGTQYNDDLVNHTLNCLSAALRPVKKKSIARTFLKLFMSASNEHELPDLFDIEQPKSDSLDAVNVITVSNYAFDDNGTSLIPDPDYNVSIICSNESVNKYLRQTFLEQLPDGDNVPSDVVDSRLVQNWLDETYIDDESESSRQEQEDKLLGMDACEIANWLVDTFDIDELTGDFFEHITMGFKSISYTYESILK